MTAAAPIAVALAGLAILLAKRCTAARGLLTVAEVRCLAEDVARRYFPRVDPMLLRAIAEVESTRDSFAVRFEERINDVSIGLMQNLLRDNATWLYETQGATAFGRPSAANMTDPPRSMYFGAAFVDWLMRFAGGRHAGDAQWLARAYNGGPGNARGASTRDYWRKILVALDRLQRHDREEP